MGEELRLYIQNILEDGLKKAVFSNGKNEQKQFKKVVILKKEDYYQIEKYTQTQAFHENVLSDQLEKICAEIFDTGFLQMNAWCKEYEYQIKITKKEKVLFYKTAVKKELPDIKPHNRVKNYRLEQGEEILPLIDMGIFTKDGQVVRSMYDKYKQINKFIEIIEDAVDKVPSKNLNIVDFGCGKSYLTFVVYYYLTQVKKRKVNMIGLDLKEEVIEKCNRTAKRYGYENLSFQVGDINGYKPPMEIDMVISLHACDTATDYALYNAIQWKAKIIISVPCCQHELCGQLNSQDLSIFQEYGIIKERTAALMTDAVRGNLLIVKGYKTQLLEFVDFEHTPKNILIRAVKSNISQNRKEKALTEVKQLVNCFHLEPTLLKLLEI